MLLKADIEKAYHAQQLILQSTISYVPRNYLNQTNFKGSHIDVISGIRRCGKSTLLKLIMKGFNKKIAYFNFEDSRVFGFELGDFPKLDEVMGKGVTAYFFDEIQNVPSWEIFVRQLHERGEKVFITGSNASLLSRELGTRLTGRHLRHELFPFSYSEFLEYKNVKNSASSFEKYLFMGGFPEFLSQPSSEILQTLLRDIVYRDIAVRYNIRNSKILMDLTLYLISNIGKEITYNSLRKTFQIGSSNSVSDYLTWLEDTYVLFFLPRFGWSAKSISVNPRKVYAIDNGMVNSNSLSFSDDQGRLLENLIFLHLRKQPLKFYYFREGGECDFVVFEQNKCKELIQVCSQLHEDNKSREISGLMEAMSFFKKREGTIITMDQKDQLSIGKSIINIVPAHEFVARK